MLEYKEAKNILLNKYDDSVVMFAFEIPSSFVLAIKPKSLKEGEIVLDAFFAVDKKTGEISEYAFALNIEEFHDGMENHKIQNP